MKNLTAHLKARAVIVNFGRRVREYRLAAEMSQPKLGRLARISAKSIGHIERGTTNTTLINMAFVADALGVELADLLQPADASRHIMLTADDSRRAQEAVSVLRAVLRTRLRARREAGTRRKAR